MKHQDENPAYIKFGQMLGPSGKYPAEHVDIFWNMDSETRMVTEVEVVFIPRTKLADREFQAEYSAYNKRWTSDLGNSTDGWLKAGGYTPEMIFGILLERGFVSAAVTESAIEEFASIEECGWARSMLRGFRDE